MVVPGRSLSFDQALLDTGLPMATEIPCLGAALDNFLACY